MKKEIRFGKMKLEFNSPPRSKQNTQRVIAKKENKLSRQVKPSVIPLLKENSYKRLYFPGSLQKQIQKLKQEQMKRQIEKGDLNKTINNLKEQRNDLYDRVRKLQIQCIIEQIMFPPMLYDTLQSLQNKMVNIQN